MSKLSETTNRTTVFIPKSIKDGLPKSINLSGLIRDLLSDYINHGVGTSGKWKEGFKELYDFFQDVMANINIIKNKEKWNDLLQKRNLVLLDKLRGEL